MIEKSELYVFAETVLSDFHTDMGRFYFRINIETPTGQRLVGNTESIYTTRSSIANFEEWYKGRVLVAYDLDSKKVIVLAKK